MDDCIQPYANVAIRLPSDAVKIQQITPNTTVSLGKFGSFPANLIIGRPYHLTFEIQEKSAERDLVSLRIISPAELYEDIRDEDAEDLEDQTPRVDDQRGEEYEVVNPEGKVVMRTNKDIMDSSSTQKLSTEEIEALKKGDTASGKDTIAKILESHSALDKKTAFSLAKYTLRKRKKFMKRFTVFPMDVATLANYMLYEKDPKSIMEIREEILSLILSWSNVHAGGQDLPGHPPPPNDPRQVDTNRWLVVDETGGLVVAAMAERMGILYPTEESARKNSNPEVPQSATNGTDPSDTPAPSTSQPPLPNHDDPPSFATTNTLTLLHPATQPNLSLLSYFSHDPSSPSPTHPLTTHLKPLSWLQLLHPTEDPSYRPPPPLTPSALAALKSGKRAAHHRKRRRWARTSHIVDEARAGGFAGLVVASAMEPASVLRHLVPLLRGGAQVVVYAANVEPLVGLADLYSTARRGAWMKRRGEGMGVGVGEDGEEAGEGMVPSEEFPVDPTLLLATAVHTARARPWQVLPGRTHPLMMGRGGAEGYVFVGTRVLPAEGKITARGQFKRRKTEAVAGKSRAGKSTESVVVERSPTEEEMIVDEADAEDGGGVEVEQE